MKQFILTLVFLLTAHSSWARDFVLSSPQLSPNGVLGIEQVLNGFGCHGGNISPELLWKGAPDNTKSFAVTVYDPDAPTGSGWWHWLLFNIPVQSTSIAKGGVNLPAHAIQSRTDFGSGGFGGACPPAGDAPHRYIFTIWALNIETLPLDENASGAMVGFFLNSHSLAKASIVVKYGR